MKRIMILGLMFLVVTSLYAYTRDESQMNFIQAPYNTFKTDNVNIKSPDKKTGILINNEDNLKNVDDEANSNKSVLLQFNQEIGNITYYKIVRTNEKQMEYKNPDISTKKNIEKTVMYFKQKPVNIDLNGNITLETEVLSGYEYINGVKTALDNIGQISTSPSPIKFPERPVKIGDSWTIRTPANQQIPYEMKTIYTIEAFGIYEGEDCAKIKSKVSYDFDKFRKDISYSLTCEGEIFFGYKTGKILASEVKSSMIQDDSNTKTILYLNLNMNIVGADEYKKLLSNY